MSKKILIIEDNNDIRESTAEILELAGYETFTAANGKIGVDSAIKNHPDLILCDIMMPELDGYGVLYLLHKNTQTASIPFIFITAKSERTDMRKGMEMGADDYLTKPFDDIELLNAIEGRLKKSTTNGKFNQPNSDTQTLFADLIKKGKIRILANKQIIYIEEDQPTHVYFVKKGQVKTYKRFKDGRELSSALYQPGDFFGYESLFTETSYQDNAATLADSEIISIPKTEFTDYLYQHQPMSAAFIRLLSGNIRYKENQMLQLAYFSVRKRVADALIQVAEKFDSIADDKSTIKISRDDLAAIVGTASETVSRMLADFKDEKLIEKSGNAIKICSIDKLKNIKH